jgi:hypothetical protein
LSGHHRSARTLVSVAAASALTKHAPPVRDHPFQKMSVISQRAASRVNPVPSRPSNFHASPFSNINLRGYASHRSELGSQAFLA